MPNGDGLKTPTDTAAQVKPGLLDRSTGFLTRANKMFTFLVGLPIVGVFGSALVGHFDYLSSYQDKVRTTAKEQVAAAESAFTDISTTFSKAITLQQFLYFNYRDAIKGHSDGDDRALETKIARAIYPRYDELRTNLRENIDLIARKVEMSLDWSSDTDRDAANVGTIGRDQISRLALGAYDFECGEDRYMPNFHPEKYRFELPPPQEVLKENANARPLGVDWYSAKHQVLTMYYCFEVNHRMIATARKWAANSPVDAESKEKFARRIDAIQDLFDREAIRLNAFMTLAARRIEVIRVKFRPSAWYCHVVVVREIVDAYSKKCSPIRTAQN